MSKRFGRQQKRKMREQIKVLTSSVLVVSARALYRPPVEIIEFISAENKPCFGGDPKTLLEPLYRNHYMHRMNVDIELRDDEFNPDQHFGVLAVADHRAYCYVNTDLIKRSDFHLLEPICRQVADRLVEHLKQSLMQGAK